MKEHEACLWNCVLTRKHETRLTTIAMQKYELRENYAFDNTVFRGIFHLSLNSLEKRVVVFLCEHRCGYDQFNNVLVIKCIEPMKKKLPAWQRTAQPAAWTTSCTSSCVCWNIFVNFHRLGMIIPGAPLTWNIPAAAPRETKKTILANGVIIKHDILASDSRFLETKNRSQVLFWLNLV